MTNKEWIESQGLDFSEALKFWDKYHYPDFSEWLKAERGRKYKVGDVLLFINIKYVIIGVNVKSGKTGRIYAYNTIEIWPDGMIKFVSNEDVENGNFDGPHTSLLGDWCDHDYNFVKIA